MRYLMIAALLTGLLAAQTVTLDKVIAASKKYNRLTNSLDQKSLALEAKNRADTSSDPIELFMNGAKAMPLNAPKKYESSVGIAKNIKFGSIIDKERRINRLNNEADILEESSQLLTYTQAIKNIYHQHCIDAREYQSLLQNYNDLETLYKNKEKAYEYQEISRTELLQLSIEKKQLLAQLGASRMAKENSRRYLLSQVRLNENATLSCRDTYPITADVRLPMGQFTLTTEAYKKRVDSARTAISRHSAPIDSVNLTLSRDKEIDMDRYTVGVSIPLNFTSRRSEEERLAAMHNERAATYKYEETIHQKRSQIKNIRDDLRTKAQMIDAIRTNIEEYRTQLLPLIKKSYDLGESSVIEYLLNRQKYYELRQQLYATQKEYYQSLFTLYSLIEKKD